MADSLLLLIITFAVLGIWFVFFANKQKKKFGVLNEERVYIDTDGTPGETLFSKTISLAGKPDYIVKENGYFIPVEYKSGKTPKDPYLNHTTQLMAYCFLVEEKYGVRPPGGYLKYPDREFKIAYTDEARVSIIKVTEEILEAKRSGEEIKCDHSAHN